MLLYCNTKKLHVNRNRNEFSRIYLKLRQERGLKQSDVALSIGVTSALIRTYEYGKSEPRMSTLIALADFYDLSLDELVCRKAEHGV